MRAELAAALLVLAAVHPARADAAEASDAVRVEFSASDACRKHLERAAGAVGQILEENRDGSLPPGRLALGLAEDPGGIAVVLTFTREGDNVDTIEARVVTPASLEPQIRAMTRALLAAVAARGTVAAQPEATVASGPPEPGLSPEPSPESPPPPPGAAPPADEPPPPSRKLLAASALPSAYGLAMTPCIFALYSMPMGIALSLGVTGFAALAAAPSIGQYRLGRVSQGVGFTGLRLLAAFFFVGSWYGLFHPSLQEEPSAALGALSAYSLLGLAVADIALADADAGRRTGAATGAGGGAEVLREPPTAWSVFGIGGMAVFFDERDPPDGKVVPFGNGGVGASLMVYPYRSFHGGLRLDLMWGVADGHRSCPSDCVTDLGHPLPREQGDEDRETPIDLLVSSALLSVDLRWRIGRFFSLGPRLGAVFRNEYGRLLPSGMAAGVGVDATLVRGRHAELVLDLGAVSSAGWWRWADRLLFLEGGLGVRFIP
jgi:hypothetical protein